MEEYVQRAITFGNDRNRLLALRAKLWANRLTTPLFNTRLWVREWEAAILAAWQRHCAGTSPDHIDLPPLGAEVVAEVDAANASEQREREAYAPPSGASYQYLAGLAPPPPTTPASTPMPTPQHQLPPELQHVTVAQQQPSAAAPATPAAAVSHVVANVEHLLL